MPGTSSAGHIFANFALALVACGCANLLIGQGCELGNYPDDGAIVRGVSSAAPILGQEGL